MFYKRQRLFSSKKIGGPDVKDRAVLNPLYWDKKPISSLFSLTSGEGAQKSLSKSNIIKEPACIPQNNEPNQK
jgi:hypothetical protein